MNISKNVVSNFSCLCVIAGVLTASRPLYSCFELDDRDVPAIRLLQRLPDSSKKLRDVKLPQKEVVATLSEHQEHLRYLQRRLYPTSQHKAPLGTANRVCVATIQQVLGASHRHIGKAIDWLKDAQQPNDLREAQQAACELDRAYAGLLQLFAVFGEQEVNAADNRLAKEPARLTLESACIPGELCIEHDNPLLLADRFVQYEYTPCGECSGTPQDMWCSSCKEKYNAHKRNCTVSQLITVAFQHVLVDNPGRYLDARIGRESRRIDECVACKENGVIDDDNSENRLVRACQLLHYLADNSALCAEILSRLPEDISQAVSGILQADPWQVNFAQASTDFENNSWGFGLAAWPVNTLLIGRDKQKILSDAQAQLPEGVTVADIVQAVHSGIEAYGLHILRPLIMALLEKHGDVIDAAVDHVRSSSKYAQQVMRSCWDGRPCRERYLGEAASHFLGRLGACWHGKIRFIPRTLAEREGLQGLAKKMQNGEQAKQKIYQTVQSLVLDDKTVYPQGSCSSYDDDIVAGVGEDD